MPPFTSYDCSKPLQTGNANGAWHLVRNRRFDVIPDDDGIHDRLYPGTQAQSAMAGYAFSRSLMKSDVNIIYFTMTKATIGGGVHRWKITGLKTIQEFSIPVTKL